jgi:hypothetical protein
VTDEAVPAGSNLLDRLARFRGPDARQGIHYFIAWGSAKLNRGDLRKTALTEVGFDTDRTFMLMEISGDELFFHPQT